MKVKMLKTAKGPTLDAPAGAIVEIADELAKAFVDGGIALAIDPPVEEIQPVETVEVKKTPVKKAVK